MLKIHLRGKKRLSRALMSFAFRVCVITVSLIRHPWCALKRAPFDPNSTTVLPHTAQEYCSEKAAKEHWCSAAFLANKRLTLAVTLNIAPCTSVKEYLWLEFLFEGTWTNDVRKKASKNRLLTYIQSFRYRPLYLNINIYFSWAVCLKRDVALSQIITGNCKNIWMSIWHM